MKEIDDAFRDLAEQWYRYKWNMSVNSDYLGKAIQRMHSDDAFHGPMMDYSLSKNRAKHCRLPWTACSGRWWNTTAEKNKKGRASGVSGKARLVFLLWVISLQSV